MAFIKHDELVKITTVTEAEIRERSEKLKRDGFNQDATVSSVVAERLVQIDPDLYMPMLQELQATSFIPRISDFVFTPGATYEYDYGIMHGGETSASYNEIKLADASILQKRQGFRPIINGAEWSTVGTSQGLQTSKLASALRRNAEVLNEILLNGDAQFNIEGIFNKADIAGASNANVDGTTLGSWDSATAAEMAEDMVNMINVVELATKDNALARPTHLLMDLASKKKAEGSQSAVTERSAMQIFQERKPYITVVGVHGLESAGKLSSKPRRMIVYNQSSILVGGLFELPRLDVVDYISGPYKRLSTVVSNCGGTVVRAPIAFKYFDSDAL